ncbi:hypothetical protein KDA10_02400 [candidate division WWE3 bacterium]|uniref:DMT family transporter n=1 Tax=candidate division WWE3 bacterium TaxID=2053526 RepID=A0A955E069_UNCKA|nr:hypothetical protein [candidate division WWE3 bacterium]
MDLLSTALNSWQFYLISYLVFVVIFYQSYKAAVKNAQRDGAATIVLQIIGATSILVLAPFFAFSFTNSINLWGLLIAASIFYALNDRINTTARKHLPVSTYSIISQMTTVFLMIIGFLVFKENLMINKVIGGALIVLWNVVLAYKKGGFVINKYFGLALLATLIISIAMSIDIGISKQFDLAVYISLTLGVPALMIMGAERIKLEEVKREYNSPDKKFYWITGISWGLTIISLLRAYQLGEVTTIVPLSATSTLINVLVAYVIFNEREDHLKKVLAAILVVVGITFTVYQL